ncbi:PREDICTED: putative F-box protein At3g52320 [Ipomoea nil]|uniref:putative F-box protein At3g52320 n=1 Tax=Ipomoea nil TaxID=35883 RepID=UPI000900F10D|nr:PREDICTED: putative F-box protein At3g52320 [Ipomoea nil]
MSESGKTAPRVSTLPLNHHLLPHDILFEILSKLPAKSLVRFRCVNKFFYALIADHAFGVLHRSLSLTLPSRAGILFAIIPRTLLSDVSSAPPYYTINTFSEENLQANRLGYLDSDEPLLRGGLHSSSDGLICLSRPNGDVVVCNVSTGQRISLPRFQFNSSNPIKTCALLGFDSQSKRYKVLMNDRRRSISEYKHWVLTVGVDKSWREINYSSHPFCPFDGFGCAGLSHTTVHIDGVIYSYNWISRDVPPSFHIVAFEVGSESYSLIPIPAEVPSEFSTLDKFGEKYHFSNFVNRNFALLQVDGGGLAIVYVRNIDMNVWILEKSKGCWEKITTIIPFNLRVEKSTEYRYTTNHAGEIVLLGKNSKQFTIWVCNSKSKVWRKFDISGVEFPICFPMEVRMYKTMDNVFSIE